MEYVFRSTQSHAGPDAGEIDLRPPAPHAGRIELAVRVMTEGPAAFPQGTAPIARIIMQADPTLDDMLAAALVEQMLAGKPPPPHTKLFAAYAADVRAGYKPTDLPLKDSLEGAYSAIRCAAPGDLTIAENATEFLARWRLMAARILAAAEKGVNPVSAPLFNDDADFAWVRTELAHDHDVYRQQDLPQAEKWLVRIPQGPPHRLPGLMLRRTASTLWKYSAREDSAAPGGGGYVFLATRDGDRHWRFSTAPQQKLKIDDLAARLQDAEAGRKQNGAAHDPWYDGRKHNSTIVAAPAGGTVLSDRTVLKIVRKWGRVQDVGGRFKWRLVTAIAAAALVVVGVFLFLTPSHAASNSLFQVSAQFNDQGIAPRQVWREDPAHTRNRSFFAGCDVNLKQGPNTLALGITSDRVNHPIKFWATVQSAGKEALPQCRLKITVDNQPIDLPAMTDVGSDREMQTVEVPAVLTFGYHAVDLQINSDAPAPVRLQLNWKVDLDFKRDLYLMTVGVKNYEATSLSLDYADQDAAAVSDFMAAQVGPGKLFGGVARKKAFLNEAAKQSDIFDELDALKDRVNRNANPSIVVIMFSGHGRLDQTGRFFFLPYNFNPAVNNLDAANSVPWSAVQARIRGMRWPVIVIMDTCHSGAVQSEPRFQAAGALNVLRAASAELDTAESSGVVTLAACGAQDRTWENQQTHHGTLTLAILEALNGNRLVPQRARTPLPQEIRAGEPITLDDLCRYAEARVRELGADRTDVVAESTGRMLSDLVPITSLRKIRP